MDTSKTTYKDPLKIRKIALYTTVLWTGFIVVLLLLNLKLIKQEALNRAYAYTKVGFDKDVIYRRWVSEHGGVYVRIDSMTPPSPYLSHIPNRDIILDSNHVFTLMNPAYMTRQIYELEKEISEVRGHITSLNSIRPENAPDAWERKALEAFEKGIAEVSEVSPIDGVDYFRYMRPFITGNSCLKCHALQDYKVGDIRGGISISYPMDQITSSVTVDINNQIFIYILIWFFGQLVILFAAKRLIKSDSKRFIAEESLKQFNKALEEKVEQRSLELTKSRRDWENIFNSIGTPAQLIGKDHTILFVNDETLSVFNLERKDIVGQKCFILFHNRSEAPMRCPLDKAIKTGVSTREEMIFEGQDKTFIVNCSPILDADGEIDYFMHIMTDISDRKKAELKIIENKKKLDLIFETIPVSVDLIDKNGIILDCNSSLVKLHGYENKEEIIGQHYSILFPDFEIERTKENIAKILSERTVHGLKYTLIKKDGSTFHAEISSSHFYDEIKKEIFLVSAAFDVSERIEMDIQFQTLFEQASDAIYLSDFDGNIIDANNEAVKEMGYSRPEFQKLKIWDLDNEWTDPEKLKTFWETMKPNEPITFESVHKRKDGTNFPIELRAGLFEIKGEKAILGFARNITERKKSDYELMKLNQDLDKRIKDLDLLLEISQTLIQSQDLKQILQSITDYSTKMISLDSTAIYLVQGVQVYLGAATPAIPPDFPEEFRYANIKDHPHIAKCISTAKAVIIPDLDKEKLSKEEEEILKVRSFKTLLYVPLMIESRAVGVLIMGTIDNLREFTKPEIDLFVTLSVQSALTIENALLYKDAKDYSEKLEQNISQLEEAKKEIINLNSNLEEKIRVRTKEIEEKNEQLERINKLFIGRENRMAELKEEMEKLRGNG